MGRVRGHPSSLPFYLPAFLCHALHHPAGGCELSTLLVCFEQSPADPTLGWTRDQRCAIARFLAFVVDDQRWASLVIRNRDALSAWLALVA